MWAPGKAVEDLGWRVGICLSGTWTGLSLARGSALVGGPRAAKLLRPSSCSPRRRWMDLAFHGPGAGIVIVKGRPTASPGWQRLTWHRVRHHADREPRPGGGLTYNWMGQRKSAAGLRVTVTSPRLCAVSTAWAEVRRNGVVPGVKVTLFTAHRPPR